MSIIRTLFPVLAFLTVFAALVSFPQSASAQSCTTTVTAVSFGNADVTAATPTDTTAELKVSCSGYAAGTTLLACPALGAGSGGVVSGRRVMLRFSGSQTLDYELYSNSGRTQVWGSAAVPQMIVINNSGSGEATATIFARVFGGQSSVPVGSYSSTFSGSDVSVRYGLQTGSETCASTLTGTATASFAVTATVTPQCTLTTTNINFGTVGALSNPVTASGTVTVRCTSNAGYTISMDGGISKSTDPTQRWMGGTTPQTGVSYGLYQNSQYSLPWGNTPGLTKADIGSGSDKIFTVYGRTNPSTITPPADTYNDTVIVTVTY